MIRCSSCRAAQKDAWSGMYTNGCRACTVRMVSHAPENRREGLLTIATSPEDRQAMLEEARTEWRRRRPIPPDPKT